MSFYTDKIPSEKKVNLIISSPQPAQLINKYTLSAVNSSEA